MRRFIGLRVLVYVFVTLLNSYSHGAEASAARRKEGMKEAIKMCLHNNLTP